MRINGGSPPAFEYKFTITAYGGSTKVIYGMIEVTGSGFYTPTDTNGLCADYTFVS